MALLDFIDDLRIKTDIAVLVIKAGKPSRNVAGRNSFSTKSLALFYIFGADDVKRFDIVDARAVHGHDAADHHRQMAAVAIRTETL